MSQPPHLGAPAPGDQIGPYRIVRELGRGGMGTVYEAVDTTLHRNVALKVIAIPLAGDPEFRSRFVREAQAQASLDSPHVVQVFSHGQADGRLYIASQLIPDGDLGTMLRRHGPPPTAMAVELIAQVADGLSEAHRVGLVHRDIKPANVLLRQRGTDTVAYLADFGIARQVGGPHTIISASGPVVAGTPTYMAPELHQGAPAGPASDVYSLGCLLWATLTGQAPYSGTSDFQVVDAHVHGPIPQLPARTAADRELNRVLATALAKNPGQRYPTAAAVRDDLRSVLAMSGSPGRWRAGVVAAVLSVVVALVVLTVLAVVLIGRGDDDPEAGSDPVPSSSGSGQESGSASPSGQTSPRGFTGSEEEETAIANIAAALEADGELDAAGADCTARGLVEKHGIDGLQDAGLLDDDLEFNESGGGNPDATVLADLFTITFTCLYEQSSAAE
ncbi:serine/threonine-protein kinase [Nocardioides caeni]|uniref:non-specific serine/threonine protein kinase n=1 Tax=Nocardioides caeni TaxID=574700 RepID=A0A4S8N0Q4_9ACTN|nr:serine/threonine-protein kinase [Nocardioides caeni]THV09348.1 serine/threonine protein kinase [Nocardioides caeni]